MDMFTVFREIDSLIQVMDETMKEITTKSIDNDASTSLRHEDYLRCEGAARSLKALKANLEVKEVLYLETMAAQYGEDLEFVDRCKELTKQKG
jgi:hypothetical protein